jgi:hypothetical protein
VEGFAVVGTDLEVVVGFAVVGIIEGVAGIGLELVGLMDGLAVVGLMDEFTIIGFIDVDIVRLSVGVQVGDTVGLPTTEDVWQLHFTSLSQLQ